MITQIRKRNEAIAAGTAEGYPVDAGLKEKFGRCFEEPAPAEVDVWIEG